MPPQSAAHDRSQTATDRPLGTRPSLVHPTGSRAHIAALCLRWSRPARPPIRPVRRPNEPRHQGHLSLREHSDRLPRLGPQGPRTAGSGGLANRCTRPGMPTPTRTLPKQVRRSEPSRLAQRTYNADGVYGPCHGHWGRAPGSSVEVSESSGVGRQRWHKDSRPATGSRSQEARSTWK